MLGFTWCNAWIILFLLSYGKKEVWNEVCNLVDIWIEKKKEKRKKEKEITLDFIVNKQFQFPQSWWHIYLFSKIWEGFWKPFF